MSYRPTCHFGVRSFPAVALIDAYGGVDDADACQLRGVLESATRAGRRPVVLNFAGVRRFGATGLAAVLDTCAAAARAGVALVAVCPPIARIELMVLARLATCVDVYPTETEALAAFDVEERRLPPPARVGRAA